MIHTMTGFAAVQHVETGACYALEIRSLNNRYLKLSIKLPEYLQFLESHLDRLVRERIARGSITYSLRIRHEANGGAVPINVAVLQRYAEQLLKAELPEGVAATIDLGTLAALPGVCEPPRVDESARAELEQLAGDLTNRALDDLIGMRTREGETLCAELSACCDEIKKKLAEVATRAPLVIEEYHTRLKARVAQLLSTCGIELEADSLMREVAVYAERSDVNEEISRLGSHLEQFRQLCTRGDRVGRTLEFLTQELLREANTIASKSSDAVIARSVVEIKGLIDRLREQVQNVE